MNTRVMTKAADRLRHPDWLDQPSLAFVQVLIFAAGSLFWIEAYHRAEAFDVAVFGEFAVRFPAEMWAGAMMGAATIIWVGLQNPVKRYMVAIGATLQTIQFSLLAYSAISTGGQEVIGYWASVFFAPLHARMVLEAMRHA